MTPLQTKLLADWENSRAILDGAKTNEMELRRQVQASFFPTPKEGTQRVDLANGWALKFVHKTNYTFDDKDELHKALSEIEATGNEGAFVAQRLVSFKPELKVAEYKTLADPYRKIIDRVITTKPAAPAIELEGPRK